MWHLRESWWNRNEEIKNKKTTARRWREQTRQSINQSPRPRIKSIRLLSPSPHLYPYVYNSNDSWDYLASVWSSSGWGCNVYFVCYCSFLLSSPAAAATAEVDRATSVVCWFCNFCSLDYFSTIRVCFFVWYWQLQFWTLFFFCAKPGIIIIIPRQPLGMILLHGWGVNMMAECAKNAAAAAATAVLFFTYSNLAPKVRRCTYRLFSDIVFPYIFSFFVSISSPFVSEVNERTAENLCYRYQNFCTCACTATTSSSTADTAAAERTSLLA